MSNSFPDKTCMKCGRSFSWRKKWARTWERVMYCSASCRRNKIGDSDRALEERILRAIKVGPTQGIPLHDLHRKPENLESLRQAARRLAINGHIVMRQHGHVIEPRDLHGSVHVARA